jgi:glycosyltransferase 2 family protein
MAKFGAAGSLNRRTQVSRAEDRCASATIFPMNRSSPSSVERQAGRGIGDLGHSVASRLGLVAGPASTPGQDDPYRRRTSDWARVGVAVVALAWLAARRTTRTEAAVMQAFTTLPAGLHTLFAALYRVGAIWAVAVLAITALAFRRWRLARDLALAGGLAWVLGRLMGVVDQGGVSKWTDVFHAARTPTFPLVRLAVIEAVLIVAGPYLTRPARRTGQVFGAVMAPAAMYLNVAALNDLAGGLVLGWGIAAAVHLAVGSPAGRPTPAQVKQALADIGVSVQDVRLAPVQPPNQTVMMATDATGGLRVRVIGRDEAGLTLLSRLWRFVYYRDRGEGLYLTRSHEIEHEAYCLLAAAAAGARVPGLIRAGMGGRSIALEVERLVPGPLLRDLDAKAVDTALLADLWSQVCRLGAARIAHGALDAEHVIVAEDGPFVVGFSHALDPADEHQVSADVAELLVATSLIVGNDEAINAAMRGVGPAVLTRALPLIQPATLTRATREAVKSSHQRRGDALERLRKSTAKAAGTKAPPLTKVERVDRKSLLMAIGALLGVGALLGSIGDPGSLARSLAHASPLWLAASFGFAMASNFGYALALMGASTRPLPLGATTELQVATSFSNVAVPLGGAGLQVRFLQKQGVDLATAVAAGGLLSTVAGVAIQLGMLAVAIPLSPHAVNVPLHGIGIAAGGLGVLLIVAGVMVLRVPLLRRHFLVPAEHALDSVLAALRSPSRLALLVTGNVLATLLVTLSLLACVYAYGRGVSFWSLLAVQITVSTIASLAPIPGGSTAIGSVGLSGALALYGVPQEVAVAAVLTNQVVATYLPAIPGWFATQRMTRRDLL